MPEDTAKKSHKRMVVEEVVDAEPVSEIKETVEEETKPASADSAAVATSAKETGSVEAKKDIHFPEMKPEKDSKPSNVILWIIIPGVFLLGAVLGVIVFYQKGITAPPKATPEASMAPVESNLPTATPVATVELSKYPIAILNGSGIAGEAGKVKALLETNKFTVASTGNASAYNFTKTIIKAKAEVGADFLAKLSEVLSKNYVLDTNQSLPASSKDSVQIIVGSTKAQ